jgi:hypothetical protein
MGINIHVYTVFGVKLAWNGEFYESYEEKEESNLAEFGYDNPIPPDLQIDAIFDFMCCNYMILGPILYDSGDFRYCDDMNDYQEIDNDGLCSAWLDYKEKFSRLYPDHVNLLVGVNPKLLNIIHYS